MSCHYRKCPQTTAVERLPQYLSLGQVSQSRITQEPLSTSTGTFSIRGCSGAQVMSAARCLTYFLALGIYATVSFTGV